jgi:hypothetical protein
LRPRCAWSRDDQEGAEQLLDFLEAEEDHPPLDRLEVMVVEAETLLASFRAQGDG